MAAIVCPPKTFSYLKPLARGDLPIFISDANGPVSPVRVVYSIFQVRENGTLHLVVSQQVPQQGDVGEFYVVGRAGEMGQPGTWLVRWEFQQTLCSPVEVKETTFKVEDRVAAKLRGGCSYPADTTVRVVKYGWN